MWCQTDTDKLTADGLMTYSWLCEAKNIIRYFRYSLTPELRFGTN